MALSGGVRQQRDLHVIEAEAARLPEASPVAVVITVDTGSASLVADLTTKRERIANKKEADSSYSTSGDEWRTK